MTTTKSNHLFQNSIVIIDGYGLLFSAFFAIPDLFTTNNIPIGAVYGSLKSILSLINSCQNCAIIIALDGPGATFRETNILNTYKANRKEPPQNLIPQFDIFDEMLDAISLPKYRVPTFEADDIIATFVRSYLLCKNNHGNVNNIVENLNGGNNEQKTRDYKRSSNTQEGHIRSDGKQGIHNYEKMVIVTSDKDLMQLVCDDVLCYDLKKKKLFQAPDVLEKFSIKPSNLADYFALLGDAIDNVPGVKNIGQKTAISLITKYGCIEEVYSAIESDNIDESIMTARIRQSLIDGKQSALMSKELVKLYDCIDSILNIDKIEVHQYDCEKVISFAQKYEMRKIVQAFQSRMRNRLEIDIPSSEDSGYNSYIVSLEGYGVVQKVKANKNNDDSESQGELF